MLMRHHHPGSRSRTLPIHTIIAVPFFLFLLTGCSLLRPVETVRTQHDTVAVHHRDSIHLRDSIYIRGCVATRCMWTDTGPLRVPRPMARQHPRSARYNGRIPHERGPGGATLIRLETFQNRRILVAPRAGCRGLAETAGVDSEKGRLAVCIGGLLPARKKSLSL